MPRESLRARRAQQATGPSRALLEWRRFVVETLLCCELLALVAVVGLDASHGLAGGLLIGGLVTSVLRVARRG